MLVKILSVSLFCIFSLSSFSVSNEDYLCGEVINGVFSVPESVDKITLYDGYEYREKYEKLKPKCQKDLKSCESIPMGMENFMTTVVDRKKIDQILKYFEPSNRVWEVRSSGIPKLVLPVGKLTLYKKGDYLLSLNIYESEMSTMGCGKYAFSSGINMEKIITLVKGDN